MEFYKGVSSWILSKNRTFLIGVYHRKHIRKDRFSIFWKEKHDFKRKKIKVL